MVTKRLEKDSNRKNIIKPKLLAPILKARLLFPFPMLRFDYPSLVPPLATTGMLSKTQGYPFYAHGYLVSHPSLTYNRQIRCLSFSFFIIFLLASLENGA